jgi:NADPH:quinone reductase-like Zn-dependent oxidoreductase
MAKMSGFSPIITTASPQHTAYLKSLGATYVFDRHADLSVLPNEIAKITSDPIEIVYDAVSRPETQKAAYGLLAPGGKLVLVCPSVLGNEHQDDKQVVNTFGSPFVPANRDVGLGLYGNLTSYLENGLIKVSCNR